MKRVEAIIPFGYLYKGQYWGTGNIRKQVFDFWGAGEQANLFQGTNEQAPPPPPSFPPPGGPQQLRQGRRRRYGRSGHFFWPKKVLAGPLILG